MARHKKAIRLYEWAAESCSSTGDDRGRFSTGTNEPAALNTSHNTTVGLDDAFRRETYGSGCQERSELPSKAPPVSGNPERIISFFGLAAEHS
ncbi:hypothetical protein NQZ68_010941 [Dissostichus eleginoides]|nr:hypothetical protein NQZ68_010941 [Dissostichus eleginoides]